MTIKKQFAILAATLLAIPVICVIFVVSYRYAKSPEHYMEKGFKAIKQLDLSEHDAQIVYDTLRMMPPDIETTIFEMSGEVIYSSIPEFQIGARNDLETICKLLDETSDVYFYQFTAINLDKYEKTLMLSRVCRDRRNTKKSNLMKYLIIFLFFTVCICVGFIALLSKNIFNSILEIKTKTDQITAGDITTPITRSEGSAKLNEITRILQSLETMRQSLLEAQTRKSKFIMGISHDLRTPVAIIKGYIEALRDGIITDKDEISKTYNLIEGKTERLEDMINTLINYMKLNEAEIRDQLETESITKLISDFAKEAKITGTIYKREIITDINLPNNIEIPLNKQLVNRAFENIFSNALRYTKEGDHILLTSYEEENNIIFSIYDTGIGIAQKDLDHIFELFYRGTNSRREEGMGIGLSVVKNIIDTHEWNIKVDSKKDEGTTFTIIIPKKH